MTPVSTGRLGATLSPASAHDQAAAYPPGVQALGLGGQRDGLLVVPPVAGEVPLLVALHGAGGTARQMVDVLEPAASAHGVAVLAPDSRGRTWDVILGGYGADVAFIGAALTAVSRHLPVAPGRVAVGGFSDGASYALSIGLANGDLFADVVAYSPGFVAPAAQVGRPRVFVAHGTDDRVLPIDRSSRRIVPVLRGDGYDVRYDEFPGGHVVPPGIVTSSLDWLLSPGGTAPRG